MNTLTREDIILMARDAEVLSESGCSCFYTGADITDEVLDFASKVIAAVRKECADLCDEVGFDGTGYACAELIRMRGDAPDTRPTSESSGAAPSVGTPDHQTGHQFHPDEIDGNHDPI